MVYAPSHFKRLNADCQARYLLSRLSAAEWEARIQTVESLPVRRQLACIIWWDYITRHDVHRHAPHITCLMAEWVITDTDHPAEVHRYLLEWGYPPKQAHARAYPINDNPTYRINRKPKAAA